MYSENSVVLNKVQNTLIATMPPVLTEPVLVQLQTDLLQQLAGIKIGYVLFDLSAIDILDVEEFVVISNICKAAGLMGSKTILVGLNPGVAASIVDYNFDTVVFQYALSIDDGLALANK